MQNNKFFIFLLLLILFIKVFAISEIDSLEAVLIETNGKEKIDVLNHLSKLYMKDNPEISYDCVTEAYEIAKKKNDEKSIADALNHIGNYFRNTYDYDAALRNYQQALNIYRELRSNHDIANIYDNIGHIYWAMGDFPNTLDYFSRSMGIFIALKEQKRLSATYNNLGSVYFRLGMYDESMEYFLKSLSIREEMNDSLIHSTLNNLGNICVRLCDYEKALEMYQRSLENKRKLNINTQSTLNNIGNVHIKLDDYDSALKYLSEALTINEDNKDEKRIATSLNNIAIVYEEQGKIDKALHNYQKALVLKQKIGDNYGYANTSKNLGSIYLLKKDYEQAEFYLKESLDIAKKINARDIIKSVYDLMSKYYSETQDYQKAYLFKNYFSNLRDSLFNEEVNNRIVQYRTNFTINKTLREKELLIKDNQIYKFQLEKDRYYQLTLFLIVLFLITIATFLFYNNNKKKRINKWLIGTNEKLEGMVADRTLELVNTNENLRQEIKVRKETSDKLKSSLKEKEIMLKEIQHRVKNNLQIISSIMNIQSRSSKNKESIEMFANIQNRIISMSLVQEQLYSSGDLALVDFEYYVYTLITNLFGAFGIRTANIKSIINIDDIHLNVNTAISCGLLINEIVTNSIKHGFSGGKKGEIFINMKEDKEDYLHLEIGDNGCGLPDGVDYNKPETTGMELIRIMILQLSAEVELRKKNGVAYKLRFKKLKK